MSIVQMFLLLAVDIVAHQVFFEAHFYTNLTASGNQGKLRG